MISTTPEKIALKRYYIETYVPARKAFLKGKLGRKDFLLVNNEYLKLRSTAVGQDNAN